MSGEFPHASGRAASAATWWNEPKGQGPVATAREVWEHRRLVGFLGKKSFRKL